MGGYRCPGCQQSRLAKVKNLHACEPDFGKEYFACNSCNKKFDIHDPRLPTASAPLLESGLLHKLGHVGAPLGGPVIPRTNQPTQAKRFYFPPAHEYPATVHICLPLSRVQRHTYQPPREIPNVLQREKRYLRTRTISLPDRGRRAERALAPGPTIPSPPFHPYIEMNGHDNSLAGGLERSEDAAVALRPCYDSAPPLSRQITDTEHVAPLHLGTPPAGDPMQPMQLAAHLGSQLLLTAPGEASASCSTLSSPARRRAASLSNSSPSSASLSLSTPSPLESIYPEDSASNIGAPCPPSAGSLRSPRAATFPASECSRTGSAYHSLGERAAMDPQGRAENYLRGSPGLQIDGTVLPRSRPVSRVGDNRSPILQAGCLTSSSGSYYSPAPTERAPDGRSMVPVRLEPPSPNSGVESSLHPSLTSVQSQFQARHPASVPLPLSRASSPRRSYVGGHGSPGASLASHSAIGRSESHRSQVGPRFSHVKPSPYLTVPHGRADTPRSPPFGPTPEAVEWGVALGERLFGRAPGSQIVSHRPHAPLSPRH